jgi:phage FluMu protein Com
MEQNIGQKILRCDCGWVGYRADTKMATPFGRNRGYTEFKCPKCLEVLDTLDTTD